MMPIFVIGFVLLLLVFKGIKIVPHQNAFIVEKLGRFDRRLEPGMSWIIPFVERVAYKHSLKEMAYDVHEQTAITRDNVAVNMDGVIYLKIINPVDASYGVDDPIYAATQLAQTTMRAEIGKNDPRPNLRGAREAQRQYRAGHQPRSGDMGHPVHAL